MRRCLNLTIVASVVLLFSISCSDGGGGNGGGTDSGSSGNAEPTVDVTGDWSGSWNSQNGAGGGFADLSVVQNDASVTGSIIFTGSPCFTVASVSGTVSGNDATGSMTAGRIRVDIELTVIGSQASGTYNVVNAGICTGDTGTIVLERDGTGVGNQGGTIAFVSERDGNEEIYVMNADGSNQRNISNNSSADRAPAWSPDGTQIAFVSNRDGNFQIYVMNADGTNLRKISNSSRSLSSPAWSPDGTQIAYDVFLQIYVMDADGSNQRNISNNSLEARDPAWSPDGTQIAFVSNRDDNSNAQIYVMDADGSNQRNIFTSSLDFSTLFHPTWSPDGTQIAFEESGELGIYVVDADGSNEREISRDPFAFYSSPTWSPDGTQIAFSFKSFVVGSDENRQIYVMNANGSNQRNISNSDGADRDPAWKP